MFTQAWNAAAKVTIENITGKGNDHFLGARLGLGVFHYIFGA